MPPGLPLTATPRPVRRGGATASTTANQFHNNTLVALRSALYAGLLRNTVSGDAAARHLHLHRRTLNRRLKDAGTTLRHVLDQVRFELAREMLSDSRLKVAAIAARLGYRSPSAFTRAFRRWSGKSPARWREFSTPTRDRA